MINFLLENSQIEAGGRKMSLVSTTNLQGLLVLT